MMTIEQKYETYNKIEEIFSTMCEEMQMPWWEVFEEHETEVKTRLVEELGKGILETEAFKQWFTETADEL